MILSFLERMIRISILSWFIFASCIRALSGNGNQVVIWGVDRGAATARPSGPALSFSVGLDDLQRNRRWQEHEKFPIDLGAESQRAASLVSKRDKIVCPLTLQQVRIRRLEVPESIPNRAEARQDFSNQWFIAFTFSADSSGDLVSTVALLNGVYAEQRRASPDLLRAKSPTSQQRLTRGGPSDGTEVPNPYETLHSRDLHLSPVQWDPSRGGSPFDIEKHLGGLVLYVTKKYSLKKDRLSLEEMDFQRLVPSEAVAAANAELANHLQHWVCVTTLKIGGSKEHKCTTYSLLDGTIVQVTYAE